MFLSGDKLCKTYREDPTSNLKIKIQNSKDHTPVNIFQTYLKQSNLVSPILGEAHAADFYENDTVDEFFEFAKQNQNASKKNSID